MLKHPPSVQLSVVINFWCGAESHEGVYHNRNEIAYGLSRLPTTKFYDIIDELKHFLIVIELFIEYGCCSSFPYSGVLSKLQIPFKEAS
jgi:hypothetical protein